MKSTRWAEQRLALIVANSNYDAKTGKGFIPERERRGTLIAFATYSGTFASDEGVGAGP